MSGLDQCKIKFHVWAYFIHIYRLASSGCTLHKQWVMGILRVKLSTSAGSGIL